MPPGLGEMWFKNGSVEPANPPAQVRKRAFELARPSVPAATCDIEDHPSTGQKTGFRMSHQEQLRKLGFVKRPGRAYLACRFKTMVSSAFCRTTVGRP